jgi:hypothetical protein
MDDDDENTYSKDNYDDSDEPGDFVDQFDFLKPSFEVSGDSAGLTCEVKLYEARYNHKGERKPLHVGKHRNQEPEPHRDFKSALVFTRWYNLDREVDTTELTIRSPYLKQALKQVIKEYPGINLKTGNIVIRDLPKCLFHYREELQMYGLTLPYDSDAFKHLVLLLKHMWEQLQVQYLSYNNLMESDLIVPGLDFGNLWMAFRPGDDLYTKVQGHHRIVKMRDIKVLRPRAGWRVAYAYIADNGEEVGYVENYCEIEKYDGYRPLVNLKAFPLRYHPDAEILKSKAIARGKKMMALRGVNYRMYEGSTEPFRTKRRRTVVEQVDAFSRQTTTVCFQSLC